MVFAETCIRNIYVSKIGRNPVILIYVDFELVRDFIFLFFFTLTDVY